MLVPTLMMAGKGACPVEGKTMLALKSMDLPLASTWTEILELVTLPVTTSGIGFSPRMYFSACFRISCLRQRHSALVVMRSPFSFLKGSGNLAILGRVLASGRAAT